jgi:hypothetical protein
MPRITIQVGGREPLRTTISKGTPLGLLSTDAILRTHTADLANLIGRTHTKKGK